MIEDFRIRVFMTVVEKGSLTEAAASLGISQSAVSQNIAELEKNLGGKLFERRRTGVVLTEEGTAFRKCASQILHWYAVAQEVFTKGTPESASLAIDADNNAEIWVSDGDIHITIRRK